MRAASFELILRLKIEIIGFDEKDYAIVKAILDTARKGLAGDGVMLIFLGLCCVKFELRKAKMTVQERIRQAHENIEEALLLSREHMGNKVVLTKLYHAMMESLFALFAIWDMRRLTHVDVINRFEKEYIRPGRIDRKVLDTLLRAYDLTHECDCEHMPVPTDAEVRAVIEAVRVLIDAVEEWLKRPVTIR